MSLGTVCTCHLRSPILVLGSLEEAQLEAVCKNTKRSKRSKENKEEYYFASEFACVFRMCLMIKVFIEFVVEPLGLRSLAPEMSLEVQPRNARLARLSRHERQPDARCQMDIETVSLQSSSPVMT